MTMNAAVMNLFLLLLGMIPIGHYAFAPSYYLSSSSSIASSSSSSSSTRLYYNNNNNSDNSHDTVGSDGESYFDEEKEQLQAERDRLVSLFASSSSSSSPPSPTAPSSPSSSSGKDKKDKKKMYFASKKLEKSSSTEEGNKQTKKEATNSSSSNSNKKKTKEEVGSSSRPSSPLPKKLSSMARKSLEMEMKLLESLKDSDDAQGEIWNFWYNHRGYKKMTYLYGAGQMSQHPNQWSEAELILRELIQQESDEFSSSSSSSLKKSFKQQNKKNDRSSSSSEKTGQVVRNESISSKFQSKEKDDTKAKDNGKDCNSDDDDGGEAYYSGCYGWVEPVNRLATLLFYQGRLKEAKELCEFVLTYKPWHFGCQTGIVTVCQHLNDTEGIEYWSSKRMPPLVVKNNDATTNNNNKPIIPPGFSSNVNSNNNKENTNNNPTPREVWVNNMLQEAQNMLDFNGYDEDDDCQNCEEDMEVLLKGKEEEDDDEDENQNVWE